MCQIQRGLNWRDVKRIFPSWGNIRSERSPLKIEGHKFKREMRNFLSEGHESSEMFPSKGSGFESLNILKAEIDPGH